MNLAVNPVIIVIAAVTAVAKALAQKATWQMIIKASVITQVKA